MDIAKTLEEATPALDFDTPLPSNDDRWTDLSKARGSGTLARLERRFRRQPENNWLHAAFISHRGAGKTTELNRLTDSLSDLYFPVFFEADREMDANSFAMEDLLLVIAREVEKTMRDRGTPISKKLLERVESWFSEIVNVDDITKNATVGVGAEGAVSTSIPAFAKFMAGITAAFKLESVHKESIKHTLKKYPSALMQHVNNLLDDAAETLKQEGLRLLLVIDNMDRYNPKDMDELLVRSSDRFKVLHCHLIVTPPIGLVLQPESESIENLFHCESMPTIKLREKDHSEFSGPGKECLLNVLKKRIDVDLLIPDTNVQDRLIAASGGAIRELLKIAQDATLDADGETIAKEDLERTLDRIRQRFRDRIDTNGWWNVLRNIKQNKRLDEAKGNLDVLYQRLAFHYNGENWYDVHPLVAELLNSEK